LSETIPTRTNAPSPRIIPFERRKGTSLILDLRKRKIGIGPLLPRNGGNGDPSQSILIPEVDARENFDILFRIFKRTMDVTFSAVALLISSPVFLIIAVLIKFDSRGSVFYKQERTGKDGRRFKLYKFRTMRSDSEELKKMLEGSSHLKWPDFKMKDDPRVTKIGHVLRKFSLDELPNFINVFKGDMSLVGPRPTSFRPEAYKDWHKLRLKAKPGLTGLQQVSDRANLQFDERVLIDLQYILYQSITLDISILFRTIMVVISTRGSY